MKMSIGGKEIKGGGGWSMGNGKPIVEFSGTFKKNEPKSIILKKGDLLKLYYDNVEYSDAVVTSVTDDSDGGQILELGSNKG